MTFQEYLDYFEQILKSPDDYELYRDEEYLSYTKLNWSRTSRWLKRFEPSAEMKAYINSITEHQHWILITEPWCGDAAHIVPQIYQILKDNENIDLEIQLRDAAPNLIEDYLTNGSKSIPKLIIRNDVGHDRVIWGPRPQELQDIFEQMKADDCTFEDIKEDMQKWYNADAGVQLQKELLSALA